MGLRNEVLTDWRWRAGLIVVLSVILGIVVGQYTRYHMIEVILGVNAVAGLVAVVYQLSNRHEQPRYEEIQQEEESENGVINMKNQNKNEQQRSRIGSSNGLTAEERAVQNEMIRRDYRNFYQNPVANAILRQPTVNGVSGDWEEDGDTIRKVWRISTDDGFYDKRKNSWELSPKAVERAEELGEDILINEEIQNEILGILIENYRDNPMRPAVSRDMLIKALDCSEDELDLNIWFLKKKRYVETEAYLGDSRGYREVKITDLGRRILE